MSEREQMIAEITREVLARLQANGAVAATTAPAKIAQVAPGDGVFLTVDEAVKAAAAAQKRVAEMSMEDRGRICSLVRRMCAENAVEWATLELAETKLGRLDHKIEKLQVVRHVLGVEAMETEARTDSTGLCVIEHAPWGVIGMVLPATHSVPTMAGNAINIVASGNAAVFSPHPTAAKIAAYALQAFNRQIVRETGVANVLTTVLEASIRAAEEMFHHPGVALLCVTGGPGVVKAAMKSGKRVIGAGPGNPPVVVDETADLDAAAKCIIAGGSYDNNLLCIGEKEVFVVEQVADAFMAAMERAGAVRLDAAAVERLKEASFSYKADAKGCSHPHLNRDMVGRDTSVLAAAAGVNIPRGTDLLFAETSEDHVFVQEEQMMPFVPVVRVKDFDAAVAASIKAEHGFRHTAIIHTSNVNRVTVMAKALNTTLFIHNGSAPTALGLGGAGYLSYSIATPTGEGVTTPMTFTRQRQLAVVGALRITG